MIARIAVAAIASVFLLVACGGDDDGPAATIGTPVGTKDFTPTPTPESTDDGGTGDAPDPVEPTIDEELTEITRGSLEATIQAGESFEIDPVAVAQDVAEPPPCTNFLFAFSWQVTNPFPADGVALSWLFNREGGDVEVASGPAGQQGVGCGLLNAANNGDTEITVAIKYAVGGLPE